ncbi:4Fe-4S binding protein [Vibrio sp. FNV 38]|nr:4Fe-4S binding protein [Vibrio sp. FNV 38]
MTSQDGKYIKATLEHNQISRRGLFRGLVSGAKNTTEQAIKEPFLRAHPRPPSCVDEVMLDKLCNSCGDCVDACEQRVIKLIDGKPQLSLDCNYCTDCQDCQTACKTGALSNSTRSTGVIPTFGDRCQRLLFGQCEVCKSSCPKKAIETKNKRPNVSKAQCNGCGECRTYCPMNAISFTLTNIHN